MDEPTDGTRCTYPIDTQRNDAQVGILLRRTFRGYLVGQDALRHRNCGELFEVFVAKSARPTQTPDREIPERSDTV